MTWGAWGEGPKLTVAMTTSAYVEVFISAVEVDDGELAAADGRVARPPHRRIFITPNSHNAAAAAAEGARGHGEKTRGAETKM